MRFIIFMMTAAILLSTCGCRIAPDPDSILEASEGVVSFMGKLPLTPALKLVGRRDFEDGDRYTGEYRANCDCKSGTDIIFGGASFYPRNVKIYGRVTVKSGEAVLTLKLGAQDRTIVPDEDGRFSETVCFDSGSNYIQAEYESFTGDLWLICEDA